METQKIIQMMMETARVLAGLLSGGFDYESDEKALCAFGNC